MNTNLIEQLLNEDESTALDFKQAQYPFDAATDEQKSELLKDILAFANAWRRADSYILIGVEEVKGGRSRIIGVTEHLDDAKLQQFVNSKTQRPISFSYEAFPFESLQIGIIRIPLQTRPAYLKHDYGRLKKHIVYVRRGSSTAVADPDEISKMGSDTGAYQPTPMLCLIAKATKWDTVIIAIKNEGKGIAKAPYLSFTMPDKYRLSPYGVDGHYTEGILGAPLGGSDLKRLRYGAKSNIIIHPTTTHEVAALQYSGSPKDRPAEDLSIEYELAAENMEPIQDSFNISAYDLASVFDTYQSDDTLASNSLEIHGRELIQTSKELTVLSCKILRGKANRMIGRLVGVREAQVVDIHPLRSGYTHFLLKDPDYFDCVIKQGEPIEDIIIDCPQGHFYGIIRDDLFNYPFLYITEYEPLE